MRKLICLLALLASVPASARTMKPMVQTEQFAVDVCTTSSISVSSSANVDVMSNSNYLSSATVLDVYNQSASTGVACGFETVNSTITTNQNYGREIWQKTSLKMLADFDKILHFYCMSEGLTASMVTVLKCR